MPPGYGDITVHEIATDPADSRLAYLSYYPGGIRVIKVGRQGIREVGHYVDDGGSYFWGIVAKKVLGPYLHLRQRPRQRPVDLPLHRRLRARRQAGVSGGTPA